MCFTNRADHWRALRTALLLGAALILAVAWPSCGGGGEESGADGGQTDGGGVSGEIAGDGSSTVYPITEAVVEEFGKVQDVQVTVGISGTGGGFERFCNGETDFNNASRPIKETEKDNCANHGIEYLEFQVAYDGLSIVVNPTNDFMDCITVPELKAMWDPSSTISNWSQVREGFPDRALKLYGPGTDSGTFDYFTSVIVGTEGSSRSDYTASEDDNVLVQGVAGDQNALGYFGYAYYSENTDKLKLLSVDAGDGNCVAPSPETILGGTYTPLSRPLYVYFTKDALKRAEVKEFMRFYLDEGAALAEEVGYVAAPAEIYEEGLAKLRIVQ